MADFIIYPSFKEIKEMSNEIYKQKEQLEKLYLAGQFLKPTQKQYEKIKPQTSELSKMFIIKNQELEIISALENIASKNNLKQKIDLEEPKENPATGKLENNPIRKYQPLTLNIQITGNYINFLKYLIDLETLDYYINIKDFRIFSQGDGGFIIDKTQSIDKNDVSILINSTIFRTQ